MVRCCFSRSKANRPDLPFPASIREVSVRLSASASAPLEKVELIVDGAVAQSFQAWGKRVHNHRHQTEDTRRRMAGRPLLRAKPAHGPVRAHQSGLLRVEPGSFTPGAAVSAFLGGNGDGADSMAAPRAADVRTEEGDPGDLPEGAGLLPIRGFAFQGLNQEMKPAWAGPCATLLRRPHGAAAAAQRFPSYCR